MNNKRKLVSMELVLFLVVFFITFQGSFGASKQTKSKASYGIGSSVVFPVTGNVYPNGYYHVTLYIGHPPKPYFLDIDTGSDLTWLQCDAPCTKCTPAPHALYKPNKNLVRCEDPLCASLHLPANKPCKTPDDQCDYEIEYADHGSSMGVLVRDSFPLSFTNGSVAGPGLIFGLISEMFLSFMNNKRKPVRMELVLFLLVFFTMFQGSFGASKQTKSKATYGIRSSLVFPVTGNVYPNGCYHVTLNIGHPPKPYFLDIDSGSDLTWLQCDAPCIRCTPAPHALYKPNKNLVKCEDPLCASLDWPANKQCKTPDDQCDYEIEYADHSSSMGVLVRDFFPLRLKNGSVASPRLIFGCGYDQEVPDSFDPSYTDGVLGLTGGQSSIVSQLHKQGITRNILGHCLSGKGGGFLFFGDDLVPSSGVVWVPMSLNSLGKRYVLGPTELLYGNRATGVKGLLVIFDSGSTYSYFSSDAYKATLAIVKKDLNGRQLKDAVEDQNLPVCWKGAKPFKSIHNVKNYFKPLVLRFTKAKNVLLRLPPEAYLIITKHGNACLGILNGTEAGPGDVNILGDISLQDKKVIYDNEKQQIGWVAANCDRLPNTDRNYIGGSSHPFASNMDIFEEHLEKEL